MRRVARAAAPDFVRRAVAMGVGVLLCSCAPPSPPGERASALATTPTPIAPFDFDEVPANPTLQASAATGTGLGTYQMQFQWSTDPTFATGVSSGIASGVASGATASLPIATALTSGTVYWWRAEASDDGGATYGPFSTARSFTLEAPLAGAAPSDPRWFQTSTAQLSAVAVASFSSTQVASPAAVDGEVVLSPGALTGTYTSPPIPLSSVGAAWGELAWTWLQTPQGGTFGNPVNTIGGQLEYFNGAAWAAVPDAALPGNSLGRLATRTDLSGLVPASTYAQVRLKATITRSTTGDTSPSLRNVTFAAAPQVVATTVQNGDFEATGGWTVQLVGENVAPTVSLQATGGLINAPNTGARYAFLQNNNCAANRCNVSCADIGVARSGFLRQTLTIPTNATTLNYALAYGLRGYGPSGGIFVRIGNAAAGYTTLDAPGIPAPPSGTFVYSGGGGAPAWLARSPSIATYRGKTVTLEIGVEDDDVNYYWSGNCDHAGWIAVDSFSISTSGFADGAVCTNAAQCASGFCSPAFDGSATSYCTATACAGCTGGNPAGACVNASSGADPNGFCATGASAICQPGTCNGAGACTLAAAGTDCGSGCSGASLSSRLCDGAGACVTSSASCGAYVCASASACNTSCSSSAQCVTGDGCALGACLAGAPPVITSTPSLVGHAFEPYQYSPPGNAVVASGSLVRFQSSGPAGLAIDPLSGRVYWEPTSAGSAPITVTASNPWGATQQAFTVVVDAPRPPSFAHDANLHALVGVPYALNASGAFTVNGAQPIAFSRTLGPSELFVSPSTGRVDWTPRAAGPTAVSVTAQNAYGSDTYAFTVDVAATTSSKPPTAVISATPSVGEAPLAVQFDSSRSTADPGAALVSRLWIFGDGSPPSTEVAPMHLYARGAWVARLLVEDNLGQSASAATGIQASLHGVVPPLARIVASPESGAAPLSVRFSCACAAAPNLRLRWSFGDGDQSSLDQPTHLYATPGGYEVKLEVLDETSGQLGTDRLTIAVSDAAKLPPVVRAFAVPVAGDAPLDVQFGSQLGAVQGFQWTLGEGDSSTDPSPRKTFTRPGLYQAVLTAVDANGLSASASVDIAVLNGGVLPPSLLSTPSLTAQVGVPYAYSPDGRVHARGDRPLTFRLGKTVNGVEVNHPAGMTIDPATGQLAWTPTRAQAGAQPVTIVVENAAGADFQDFVVQVSGGGASGGCAVSPGRADPAGLPLALALLGLIAARLRRRRA